jgi:putative Mg2+ transporter-C (MgtC) family protein
VGGEETAGISLVAVATAAALPTPGMLSSLEIAFSPKNGVKRQPKYPRWPGWLPLQRGETLMKEEMTLIGNTIVAEFSDLNDLSDLVIVVIRLLVAAFLGGLLGLEREQRGKSAGIRTHMLVCMGAALFILIPQQAGISDSEMSRVIQGVIAGIGFLCAGTIITGIKEEEATGLTTAAGIWFTAAIGIAVGLGQEQTAVLCTLLAWLVLYVVPLFTRSIRARRLTRPTPVKSEQDSEA